MFVVMNREKWNSLPGDIKKVFTDVSSEYIEVHGRAWDTSDREGEKYTKQLKNEILQLSDAESARWVKAVEPVIKEYVTESGKKRAQWRKGCAGIEKTYCQIQQIVFFCQGLH